jgi:hypothetical protein
MYIQTFIFNYKNKMNIIEQTDLMLEAPLEPYFPNNVVMTLFGTRRKYIDGAINMIKKVAAVPAVDTILITLYPSVPEADRILISALPKVRVCDIFVIDSQDDEIGAMQRVFSMFHAVVGTGRYIPVDVDPADHQVFLVWIKRAVVAPPSGENTIVYQPLRGSNRAWFDSKPIAADLCKTYLDVVNAASSRETFRQVCSDKLPDILNPTTRHSTARYRKGYGADETLMTDIIAFHGIACRFIAKRRRERVVQYRSTEQRRSERLMNKLKLTLDEDVVSG